jgi:hypothetical protein
MEFDADCARAKEICSHIKDEGARFFWLKLGEAIAVNGRIPRLVPDDAPDGDNHRLGQ